MSCFRTATDRDLFLVEGDGDISSSTFTFVFVFLGSIRSLLMLVIPVKFLSKLGSPICVYSVVLVIV